MLFKKSKENAVAPISGKTVHLSDVKDDVFSKKMMGEGIAIVPSDAVVVSPVDGVISATMETNHAIGISTESGIEIIIHIGLDTVHLNGEGFTSFVSDGDRVKAGDKLIEFNIEDIKSKGYDVITMLVVPNANNKKLSIIEADKQLIAGQTKVIEFK